MTKVLTLASDGSYQEIDVDITATNFDGGGASQAPGTLNIDFGDAGSV